jgi:adenosylmethionine-8-amino-7-oxononanoate aminotransferase
MSRTDAASPPAPGSGPAAAASVSANWVGRDAAVVWHGFTQMSSFADNAPIVVESAEGRELIDVEGRRYFDAISSLWVTTLGHRVHELDAAVIDQLGRVAHSTMLGNANRILTQFAEELVAVLPVDDAHLLFASDGSSAVEQALKIAFQYHHNLGEHSRRQFVALTDAYHGDTIGSLSLGGGGFGTELFDPLRFPVLRSPGYRHLGWADELIALLERRGGEVAAVVLEPLVQAASGMFIAEAGELRRVADATRRAGALLVCDEVATGFGRTGALFASTLAGVRPDLLCMGKGITGGYLPMSATAASGRVFSAFLGPDLSASTLYHGHSYGGNALAAAVGRAHLHLLLAPELLRGVEALAGALAALLEEKVAPLPAVREIRQLGLMVAVELEAADDPLFARKVAASAVESGVLLRSIGDVVPIVLPLTTTRAEADRVVTVLADAITSLTSSTASR